MGNFLKRLKAARNGTNKLGNAIDSKVQERFNKKSNPNRQRYNPDKKINNDFSGEDEELENNFDDFSGEEGFDDYDDKVSIQPSQKSESFHHFILENQYKDLERSIRGFKDVFVKETQQWELKRKKQHCFTDEEAEDILRTAQSHLATDVKLGRISKDTFGDYMDAIYKQLTLVFERIAEYKYGRYATFNEAKTEVINPNFEIQGAMKSMNLKIFLELWTRIQMNYSRAIGAAENMATHQSVKGQESLQNTENEYGRDNRRDYA